MIRALVFLLIDSIKNGGITHQSLMKGRIFPILELRSAESANTSTRSHDRLQAVLSINPEPAYGHAHLKQSRHVKASFH